MASANAYIGAFPIAAALAAGADIVVTGRCVDSAVTLGACIHEFGWSADELDKLSAGSAIGHLIECGPQATGGNFTDWEAVADSLHNVGYPIAESRLTGPVIFTSLRHGWHCNRGLWQSSFSMRSVILRPTYCLMLSVTLRKLSSSKWLITVCASRVPVDAVFPQLTRRA